MVSSQNNRVEDTDFQNLVEEALDSIPAKFVKLMENVAVVVSARPTPAQLRRAHVPQGSTLLGLYEGVPQIRRGYEVRLPDRIVIFEEPIRALARTDAELRRIIRNTVWHEIAHHFGTGERRIREIEHAHRR